LQITTKLSDRRWRAGLSVKRASELPHRSDPERHSGGSLEGAG
jgi:hypothetical protein